VNVEIPQHTRDTAINLGAGVPHALEVLAGRLENDPDMGRPSGLPSVLTVMVDGDMFEDCPALAIGYIREPDRIEIRFVSVAPPAEPAADVQNADHDQEQGQGQGQGQGRLGLELDQDHDLDPRADPSAGTLVAREVNDAWLRITHWLQHHAPDSHAALRVGVDPGTINALERRLGIRIPIELRALWLLVSGDDGVDSAGCLPGNKALMTLDAVAADHRMRMDWQAREDTRNAGRREDDDGTPGWKAAWIPVVTRSVNDRTSGLYLDSETGFLGQWSRYNEPPAEELDTLVTYLEEAADMLEAPALATRDRPGLIGGALVWANGLGRFEDDRWQPLAG
jgi:cell wall assembly regulator SMI1